MMLSDSKQFTKDIIFFSIKADDFEKLDFKNDALAGVRANYFNSSSSPQSDITEVSIDSAKYKLSYSMSKGKALAWKVTRNGRPYQSIKLGTGGIYSVIFYGENGIIYKRVYFDKFHNWLRTEYFHRHIEGVLLRRIYPVNISGIIVLQVENFEYDGSVNTEKLFPSNKIPTKKCSVLAYTNEGMLWYDSAYCPENLQLDSNNETEQGGFDFKEKYFTDNNSDFFDITESDYLNLSENIDEVQECSTDDKQEDLSSENEKTYSAYDKIERILIEAHKNNKDLFGEIINQTNNTEYAANFEKNANNDFENEIAANELSTEEGSANNKGNFENSVAAETLDNDKKTVEYKEFQHNTLQTEENSDNTEINEITSTEACKCDNVKLEDETASTENNTLDDSSDNDGDYDTGKSDECDVVIVTKSGRYAYYGKLDENKCRTGRGRTVNPDGITSYDGDYLNDNRDGFGVCYYKNGSINYVGKWSNNDRNGSGVGYRLSDGTMHAGKWHNNSPDGYGARFDFEGNFLDVCNYSNGIRNGKSVSFDDNGNVVISIWKDGEKVSEKTVDLEV